MELLGHFDSKYEESVYRVIKSELEWQEIEWYQGEGKLVSLTIAKSTNATGNQIPWMIQAGVVAEKREYKFVPADNYNLPSKLIVSSENHTNFPQLFDINKTFEVEVLLVPENRYYGLANPIRPLLGGCSSMNHKYRGPGTLGCTFRLKNDSSNYVLSNWHVFVNSNGRLGDPIMQPCRLDGGRTSEHSIGELVWYRLDSHFDAAIAKVYDTVKVGSGTTSQQALGSIVRPEKDMEVQKHGRSTKCTHGRIIDFPSSVQVLHSEYPDGKLIFKNQIRCRMNAENGDSGSIVTTTDGNLVGLLFAGDIANFEYCLANPLDFTKESDGGFHDYKDDKMKIPQIETFN